MTAGGPVPEGTRARILATARDHLRRFGRERLSVVHVAKAAGMTHANVYRYFASKAALAEEIGAEWLRVIEQRLSEITQAPDPAYDKLERFLTLLARGYEDKARTDREVFALLAESGGEGLDRHVRRVRDLLGRIIEEGVATRVFPAADPRRTEQLIFDVMHRFIDVTSVLRCVDQEAGRAASWESRRERATRLLARGLAQQRE